jgi:hypothetical protein
MGEHRPLHELEREREREREKRRTSDDGDISGSPSTSIVNRSGRDGLKEGADVEVEKIDNTENNIHKKTLQAQPSEEKER